MAAFLLIFSEIIFIIFLKLLANKDAKDGSSSDIEGYWILLILLVVLYFSLNTIKYYLL